MSSHGDGKHRERDVEFAKQLEHTPYAGTAAVFVQGFHAHVALALQRLRRDHFREEGLRFFVAVEDVALAAFFVVEYERQGDTGVVRPMRMRRVGTVTNQVAWVVCAHSIFLIVYVNSRLARPGVTVMV